jgi:cytochrome c-type biogenesis protein CcmH
VRKLILALSLAMTVLAAQAKDAAPAAADPLLEKRVTALASELRCLVCQNQTLADSHADLALDLKQQIREKLAAGMSEAEVVDFMVQRYGDFVLYRPPLKGSTWLLWFGPLLLLVAGCGLLLRRLKVRRPGPEASPEELRRAAALLDGGNESEEKK